MTNIHQYWVYILSNKTRSVLYIDITNDLYRRFLEHKHEVISGFTQRYKCHYLVYYEEFQYVEEAITREKELKGWTRLKKEKLIKELNPTMKDLALTLKWT